MRTVKLHRRLASQALLVAVATVATLASAPIAAADDTVTYEISSDVVPVLAGVEYRDVGGKHLLQDVQLPWSITVPVANPTSPEADGAELRADWRPDYRTIYTVGGLLRGQFVTTRISSNGKVLCESTLDVGNVTCYGSVPHTP